MRGTAATGALLSMLALVPQAPAANDEKALALCRAAFDAPSELSGGEPPGSPFDFLRRLGVPRARELMRNGLTRQLALLHEAASLGHLPSRYHLATYFGSNAEELDPPGLLGPEERRQLLRRLAAGTFPLAEAAVATGAGFFPDPYDPPDAHAAAVQRWEYFTWMTRSALRGNRMAWERLAELYPYQIDRFDGDEEDRIRGYAWTHLRSLPVHDWERKPAFVDVWNKRKQKAWARLRDSFEQAQARQLAHRYEQEVFPRLLRDTSPLGICALEPQFEDAHVIAARFIPLPVGPRPQPPEPAEPRSALGPLPVAPDGVSVIRESIETAEDLELYRFRVGEVPAGTAGIVERAICVIRDAPIFRDGGVLSVSVGVEDVDGSFVSFCSTVPRWPRVFNIPLHRRPFRVEGGEAITFSCRSFVAMGKRGPSLGCSVDFELWIRTDPEQAG